MASPLRSLAQALCLLGFISAGCNAPPAFLVETVVHQDGSCDRMIWQPKDKFLPEQVPQAGMECPLEDRFGCGRSTWRGQFQGF